MCIGSSFLSSPGHKPGKVTPMAPFSSCDPHAPRPSSTLGPSPWEVKEGVVDGMRGCSLPTIRSEWLVQNSPEAS